MFAPLATPTTRWKPFLLSTIFEISAIALMLAVNALFPVQMQQAKKYVYTNLVAPAETMVREAQPINPRLQVRVKAVPVLPTVARLIVPTLHKVREPEIEVQAPDLKLSITAPNLPKMPDAPAAKVIATNTFAAPTNALPTTTKPAAQVQTGGFGDPNGIPATSEGRGAIAAKGTPSLPMGSGFGNGFGGSKGTPGVGIAGNGVVQSSGFDKQATSVRKIEVVTSGPSSAIEILFKPQPKYTDEGRRHGIEGEVKLEVEFTATGQARVLKVVQGLGYGLDEMALRCAEQIKFKPAMHEGQPVDSTAVVHIIFQLAS